MTLGPYFHFLFSYVGQEKLVLSPVNASAGRVARLTGLSGAKEKSRRTFLRPLRGSLCKGAANPVKFHAAVIRSIESRRPSHSRGSLVHHLGKRTTRRNRRARPRRVADDTESRAALLRPLMRYSRARVVTGRYKFAGPAGAAGQRASPETPVRQVEGLAG